MSTTKAAALVLAFASGTCSSDEDAPAPAADYVCENAFDTGCRYRAQVELSGGTLASAAIAPLPGFGATSAGSFEALTGQVTLSDSTGALPDVTCDFSADLSLQSDTQDGRAVVTISNDTVFDSSCPLTCPWFLPGGGDYNAASGHFRLKMFEGQWDLEFGASTADEPEYGPLWLHTGPSSVEFGEGVTLEQPVPVAGGSWTAPLTAPTASFPDSLCGAL